MWSDPDVTRFIGRVPFSEQDVWMRILRYAGHWALMGYGYWVVEEKAGGTYVGELGFADWRRDVEPSLRGLPELGWALVSRAHGRGYATEGVRAAIAWAQARMPQTRTICYIQPDNVASIRVAEKCGYREVRRIVVGGQTSLVFELPIGGAVANRETGSA